MEHEPRAESHELGGNGLKELRTLEGFSQDVLAQKSGLARETISRIERGLTTPRASTLRLMAGALGKPES